MWFLQNHTPYVSERCFVRDFNGMEMWLVVVKATFDITIDGGTSIAKKQVPITLAPQYMGKTCKSSLLYESDLIYTKPNTDIILHGHAFAPSNKPISHFDVQMKVGSIIKKMRVFGDRRWKRSVTGAKISSPEPFIKMPLTYERSFGGSDLSSIIENQVVVYNPRNPVGSGFASKVEHIFETFLPNFEDPNNLLTSWKQRPLPIGFGPIASDWFPRCKYAGTYNDVWKEERFPLLPTDFNTRFYQSAPEDQQAQGYLQRSVRVELYHLCPFTEKLVFTLPKVHLGFRTYIAGVIKEHRANLHTVILEPDYPRLQMVWHSLFPCHGQEHQLEKTIVLEKEFI